MSNVDLGFILIIVGLLLSWPYALRKSWEVQKEMYRLFQEEERQAMRMKNKEINKVCDACGIEANRLTCLKKYGQEPLKAKFSCSTYRRGTCDVCGQNKLVTEPRDFFDPDFSLLKEVKDEK